VTISKKRCKKMDKGRGRERGKAKGKIDETEKIL